MNQAKLKEKLSALKIGKIKDSLGEVTFTIDKNNLTDIFVILKNDFNFDILIDVTAVDYSAYGYVNWQEHSQNSGFSRAKSEELIKHKNFENQSINDGMRFSVIYHLLSINHNLRLRVKVPVDIDEKTKTISLETISQIWQSANWCEREVFDMFGIVFIGHPDLRRILTDYNFQDFPLRKDFPLTGNLEVEYDESLERVIYKPVSIEERQNHPRVLRSHD